MAFRKELNMESVKKKTSRSTDTSTQERLSLKKEENERLEGWLHDLNLKFEGMIKISKSDLANFLIRAHPNHLSVDEIETIKTEYFDEVRWLHWATSKIRDAKKQGLPLTLNELLAARELNMTIQPKSKSLRGRRPQGLGKMEAQMISKKDSKVAIEEASVSADETNDKQNS